MLRRLMTMTAGSLAAMLFFVANLGGVKPMCFLALHEPDIPEALK